MVRKYHVISIIVLLIFHNNRNHHLKIESIKELVKKVNSATATMESNLANPTLKKVE
jgi:hypothetical protein